MDVHEGTDRRCLGYATRWPDKTRSWARCRTGHRSGRLASCRDRGLTESAFRPAARTQLERGVDALRPCRADTARVDTTAPTKGLVLVVEDEAAIADLVRLYLTREGFGVHVERDGMS